MIAAEQVGSPVFESFDDAMDGRPMNYSEIQWFVACVALEATKVARFKESEYKYSVQKIDPLLRQCFDEKVSPYDACNLIHGKPS